MEKNRWGRRIRAFRKLKAIQQIEFAKQLGISVTLLGQIERGIRLPTEEQLNAIASRLNIDVNELKGDKL
jgi:transcriptional regulator with XRE-family HTH domain